ncbi:MAG: hypothetical protein ACI8TP_002375 [Acidimicrobiales bacterium]
MILWLLLAAVVGAAIGWFIARRAMPGRALRTVGEHLDPADSERADPVGTDLGRSDGEAVRELQVELRRERSLLDEVASRNGVTPRAFRAALADNYLHRSDPYYAHHTAGREAAHHTAGREAAHDTAGREAAHDTAGREAAHDTAGREAAHDTAGTAAVGVEPTSRAELPQLSGVTDLSAVHRSIIDLRERVEAMLETRPLADA